MINILTVVIAVLLTSSFKNEAVIVVPVLAFASVVLIVFGERLELERKIEDLGLPGREAWIPVASVAIAIALGAVGISDVTAVFDSKFHIIALILSFALVSYGISDSGYFEFAAYKIVEKCAGQTGRLILYLFILTSVLTFFTSNDIVVLVLTPIIFSVCVYARIRNAKLVLLSQFIAANTLSMGLLIGSPTNIIVADNLKIDFVSYLLLMTIPALLAFGISLVILEWINRRSSIHYASSSLLSASTWTYEDTYKIPASVSFPVFTERMRNWMYVFAIGVVLLAVVSHFRLLLYWAAIPLSVITLVYLWYEAAMDESFKGSTLSASLNALRSLPYGIIFFAMSFFIFAHALTQTDFIMIHVSTWLQEKLQADITLVSIATIFFSGIVVNLFNDLPASAMIGNLLETMKFSANNFQQAVVIQSVLVGVNIGCYLTPVGALAGLIWFNVLAKEKARHRKIALTYRQEHGIPFPGDAETIIPTGMDLVRYGIVHFVLVATLLGFLIPFLAVITEYLVSSPLTTAPSSGSTLKSMLAGETIIVVGLAILVVLFILFRSALRRNNVALSHMSEVFVILNRIAIFSLKHRVLYTAILTTIFLGICGVVLTWAEETHEILYELPDSKQGLTTEGFIVWLITFVASGFEQEYFPQSILGILVVGVLPLVTIASVIFIIRFTSEDSLGKLRVKLAIGEIPNDRIVIINYQGVFEGFVRTILSRRNIFVVLITDAKEYDRAEHFSKSLSTNSALANRVHVVRDKGEPYALFAELSLETAKEIYFFSKMRNDSEYDMLRYVTKLDAVLNSSHLSAVEAFNPGLYELSHGHNLGQINAGEAMEVHGELIGIPKIFVECSSRRFVELLSRSLSRLLVTRAAIITFDSKIVHYIRQDIDDDVSGLNEYFRMGSDRDFVDLFKDGVSPFQNMRLEQYELDEESVETFREHFGPKDSRPEKRGRALREHSTSIRAFVADLTGDARYIDRHDKRKSIIESRLFGVCADVAGWTVRFCIPSAALSAQAKTTHGVLLLNSAVNIDEPINAKGTDRISHAASPQFDESTPYRLFIIHPNHFAVSVVMELLRDVHSEKLQGIVLLTEKGQVIPQEIRAVDKVSIVRVDSVDDMLDTIIPFVRKETSECDYPEAALRRGDRLYVFTDYERSSNPELECINIIEGLDLRLWRNQQVAGTEYLTRSGLITDHSDIYVVVESNNEETRFLFEHLFVDKIIDTARLRRSFFDNFGRIYHGNIAKSGKRHLSESIDNFFKAKKIAEFLSSFVVIRALDYTFPDSLGRNVSAAGLLFGDVAKKITSFSEPPMQLVTLCRVNIISTGNHGHGRAETKPIVERVEVSDEYRIEDDDLLVCIPVI